MVNTTISSEMSEPLLVVIHHGNKPHQKKSTDENDMDVSKSLKRSEQIQVHRLKSFLFGSVFGIMLQIASVVLFTELILHVARGDESSPSHPHEQLQQDDHAILVASFPPQGDPSAQREFIMNLGQSQFFRVAVWVIYHLSLGVYLSIWFFMMTLAISKIGWRVISSGLGIPKQITRRTCFLRTFFFINGQ
jgi:hypothetical protein